MCVYLCYWPLSQLFKGLNSMGWGEMYEMKLTCIYTYISLPLHHTHTHTGYRPNSDWKQTHKCVSVWFREQGVNLQQSKKNASLILNEDWRGIKGFPMFFTDRWGTARWDEVKDQTFPYRQPLASPISPLFWALVEKAHTVILKNVWSLSSKTSLSYSSASDLFERPVPWKTKTFIVDCNTSGTQSVKTYSV